MTEGTQVTTISREEAQQLKPQLLEIALSAYSTHAHRIGEEMSRQMLDNISREETWEHLLTASEIIVAHINGELAAAGYLYYSGNAWKFFENNWSFIRMLGVKKGFEGNGAGSGITRKMELLCRKRGEKVIALHTSEFMPEARRIYEKQGFSILRELPEAWGKRYWLYTKQLNDNQTKPPH